MSERRYLVTVTTGLAGALYAQDRFDEAQQLTDEAQAADVPDADAWSGALSLQAMLLARRGQFPRPGDCSPRRKPSSPRPARR